MFGLLKVLEERRSQFNGKIQVVKTLEGVKIVVGGVNQSGWLVRKVWDAALRKIHKDRPNIERILVLGLGGGSVARLIAMYWPSSEIIGIDIDPDMVELGKKYLGLGGVSNLKIFIEDAAGWVDKNKGEDFNLILVDLYKGAVIPKKFVQDGFIKKIETLVRSGGVGAFNHLYSTIEKEEAKDLGSKLRKIFPVLISVKPEANIIYIGYKE